MLDTSVCPQNVRGSVLSYMLAFSYIHVTIMLLYLNIIVSGMLVFFLFLLYVKSGSTPTCNVLTGANYCSDAEKVDLSIHA